MPHLMLMRRRDEARSCTLGALSSGTIAVMASSTNGPAENERRACDAVSPVRGGGESPSARDCLRRHLPIWATEAEASAADFDMFEVERTPKDRGLYGQSP
jgi:hypothetical protein